MFCVFRNVNDGFHSMLDTFIKGQWLKDFVCTESRNGPVIKYNNPVVIQYERPWERVLFSPGRDPNPFFHLYESIWMLAGRQDLAPLQYFVSSFGQFSDDGVTLNGAYGYRWRHAHTKIGEKSCQECGGTGKGSYQSGDGYGSHRIKYKCSCRIKDQLDIIIQHLKNTSNSRRAVLQMWNVQDDLLKVDTSKDVCCNLSACFSIEDGKLDMTVFNRSNDLVLGAFGANAVHFSILQEYMASRIGVQTGKYNQISNNLHLYLNPKNDDAYNWLTLAPSTNPYNSGDLEEVPLVRDWTKFDAELYSASCWWGKALEDRVNAGTFTLGLDEPFFRLVFTPMMCAFALHKLRRYTEAIKLLSDSNIDWIVDGRRWIEARAAAYRSKVVEL